MLMRGGGQEARNNNAKDVKSAKSFSYLHLFRLNLTIAVRFRMASKSAYACGIKSCFLAEALRTQR